MDKISKALKKLNKKEREKVKEILTQLNAGSFKGLDIKKLRVRDDIFRVRKGDIRIIFRKNNSGEIFVLAIERRSDTTYRKF